MNDSNAREDLDAKHERTREQRIEAIKRWVEYVSSEPPEKWGPQQNAVVDAQLDAARSVGASVAHKQRVRELAAELLDASDQPADESD